MVDSTPVYRASAGSAQYRFWRGCLAEGLAYYYMTTVIVVLGALFGYEFIGRTGGVERTFASALAPHGVWYGSIVTDGYEYNPRAQSNVAFFPLYPLIARFVVMATPLGGDTALLLVSHVSQALAFVVLAAYLRRRFPDTEVQLCDYTLLAMGLFPTSVFFRLSYSESLFLLISIASLYAIQRRWPLVLISLLVLKQASAVWLSGGVGGPAAGADRRQAASAAVSFSFFLEACGWFPFCVRRCGGPEHPDSGFTRLVA